MQRLIMIALAVIVAFLLLGLVMAALRVLLWVGIVGLIAVGVYRLAVGARR